MSRFRSARVRQLIFGFYMSCMMSLLMSGVITFMNTGLDAQFAFRWLRAFLVAWGVAFPLVTFIAPIAGKLTEFTLRQITGQKSEKPFDI
ncbi:MULTISPECIES: DUF2798 domain-containing protein [unclassified Marinobacter]|uniref:DUF2798 domain-containing protein n=1 Tax=unclassified Marinobacter TaxID=83889 RepID=UPI000BF36FEE|nr:MULTISPECIES: DUF2798 domain-containing protein [unclassified Marinobacter]PFG09427.1 uncharacterized protein DUF2798 [Marinobacter sp. LV10MA510-1]PFG51331.1 uncharacterized protein DUF2798 [Marinobacter sp. LV10R520-4]